MRYSVISRSVFIVIALLVLASCDHGSKVEAGKAKEVKSERNSTQAKSKTTSPAKSATKTAGTRNGRVASAPTRTATDDNGITQFNAR